MASVTPLIQKALDAQLHLHAISSKCLVNKPRSRLTACDALPFGA
jgi:hypothetical protein